MRAASQLSRQMLPQFKIPPTRFTAKTVRLRSDIVRIHLVNVGDRIYVSSLSPPIDHVPQEHSTDYQLDGSSYLAVKSDGLGVIDLAFRQHKFLPDWVLNNDCAPFSYEIAIVRYADLRELTIICDFLKCRAIIPTNRTGPEPFFYHKPFPPWDSWVDSGFLVKSLLSDQDPFMLFTHAKYIPLTDATRIGFIVDPSRRGIQAIHVNSDGDFGQYSLTFSQPPTMLKFLVCRTTRLGFQYPFLQFEINGKWEPSHPPYCDVVKAVIVSNVLGVWLAKTFPFVPCHFGVVVSQKANLTNSKIEN
ncbi:hypothetical protein LOZ61_001946 [Ophidiomyces ophidiicola]|uniref:Uncharacterized protein n=1 Tax=Ophidiomyces ophidiicola TaxID=1387563 RepID=A0ACB8V3K9_9EURO|nr:uncharacterized protein LOZ57_005116 [Ophidiomyces ophidiicola]KAI1915022.1 hypothetical protein LOZ61_001946 [Ophidiomyces ophidiicola]KAI1923297.1 hypothetical protein LOZ64_000972 [Ophidiomyces ophidiicola]KAI1930128.1 hypothetical protein LOZ60_001187 [Ophidiomyces ophidiicola]KAI1943169.1 hypothetical protein LOZ57_005116 [Ophidiomyces ophidiicola]KAI1965110.1 hypothetical protein LOZ59_001436 [Ophidiomyces ophidiicola]